MANKLINLKDDVSQIGLHRISKVKLELCIVIHSVFYYKPFLSIQICRKYCNEQWYTHLIQVFKNRQPTEHTCQQKIQSMGLPCGAIAEGTFLRMECEWPLWVITHCILREGCPLGLSKTCMQSRTPVTTSLDHSGTLSRICCWLVSSPFLYLYYICIS